ncbi:MAG: hypothetical protein JKY65_32040 [Planctomycetes bacterium]|nr:hypothetical protein [Planctomycetota bacterium]
MNRRSSRFSLVIGLSLAWLCGCASAPAESQPGAEPVRETQNPEAPPFGNPRPKIRPGDVVSPDSED